MTSTQISTEIVLPKQKFFVLRYNNNWQGPYDTKQVAQREAAIMATQDSTWQPYYIVKLVGAITKPVPDMTYHEVVD